MKRLSPQQVPTADAYPDGDTWLVNNCPLLLDYLVKQKYEDGSARVPSTVTFFVDSGVFKLCVNDKDAQASLYTSANTLQDALVATEKRLGENPADWRFWKRAGKAKKV